MNTVLSEETVGVMGSGTDEYEELAREVGELLAQLGVNLLTGGGRGVMRSVSRAFTQTTRARCQYRRHSLFQRA
jgi:predicted Rossmann-fold nucleotide-binding protein